MKRIWLSTILLSYSVFLNADYNSNNYPNDPSYQNDRNNRNYNGQMTDRGYYQNSQQAQTRGYYQQNPQQGYQQNPQQGYQQNPQRGYQQNPEYYQGGGCPNCPNNPGYNPNYTGSYNDRSPANPYYENRRQGQNDRELEKKIRDELRGGWFSRGYEQITANVQNGVVTLRGFVVSWGDKDALEKRIRNIEGVRNLNSQVAVSAEGQDTEKRTKEQKEFPQDRGATPADKQLNAKIRDSISSGWLWDSYKQIQLNTNNGVVVIEGFVENSDDAGKLVDAIRKIEGVRDVNPRLRTKQQQQ